MSLVDGPTSDTKGSMFRDQKTYQEISSGTSNDLEAFRDRRALSGFRSKLSILALLGCSILLVSYLRDCLPEQGGPEQDATYPDFNIVKYSSITAGAASSAVALLEDFQVYQPVLTPTGVTDDTTLDNGSENTTAIGQTATSSNCEVVLMVHSFGYSYGVPFVGKCKFSMLGHQIVTKDHWHNDTRKDGANSSKVSIINALSHLLYNRQYYTTIPEPHSNRITRKLRPTFLQIQSSIHELHRRVSW